MKFLLINLFSLNRLGIGFIFLLLNSSVLLGIHKQENLEKSISVANTASNASRMIDINNMAMYVQNNGIFASDPITGQSGLYYPRLIGGQPNRFLALVYNSGLILGAMVGDSLRAIVSTFMADGTPGAIGENGEPYGLEDDAFRVYKIGTADSLLYNRDYMEWPLEQGAPVDEFGNPLLLGDQTLWCCFTDGYSYPVGHRNTMTDPLGAEIHMMVFGWNSLDNILFIQWEILNKSQEFWRDAYVGIFADCELGGAGDDFVGSDSALALVYDYNGDQYDDMYGTDIPAFGYVFVQTPIVELSGDTAFSSRKRITGYRNLPAKSPFYFKHGMWGTKDLWGEFHCSSKYGAYQAYLRMQGLNEDGEPMINPTTGARTDWCLSGDPVLGSGWLDKQKEDRRFMLSSGPFDLAPGDAQTIAIAVVVGHGRDRLDSITKLKAVCPFAQGVYHYDGMLYVEESWVDPLLGDVSIPIGLTNLQTPIASVEFDVRFDPALLTLNEVFPTHRTENFDLQMVNISPGQARITIAGINGNSLKGIGDIVKLQGKINSNISERTVDIWLSKLDGSGIKGDRVKLTSLPGELMVDHPPSTVHLLEPRDGEEIQSIQVQFYWNRSLDRDGDSISYQFHWVGDKRPFFTTADTTFLFNGSRFFKGDTTYRWTVSVFDGQIERASPDTFSLHMPDLQEIGHVKVVNKLDFLPDYRYFKQVEVDGDFLYVLAYSRHGYYLYVFQLTEPCVPRLVESFSFPQEYSVWQFKVKDGVAYCIGVEEITYWQPKFVVLDLRSPEAFKIVHEEYLTYDPREIMIIQDNRLFIFHCFVDCMFTLFDISAPLSPVSLGNKALPFYLWYGNKNGEVADDLLYYAGRRDLENYVFSTFAFNDTMGIDSLASLSLPNNVNGLVVGETNAYVFTSRENEYWGNGKVYALNVIDISNPKTPKLQGTIPIPSGQFLSMVAQNQFLFLGHSQLDVFDIRDPEHPLQVGFSREVYSPMVVRGPWVYGNWRNNLRVLYVDYFPVSAENEKSLPTLYLYQNYPNQFNSSTTIMYSVLKPNLVEVDVFNILGQHVAAIERKYHNIGYYMTTWDGKDGHGNQCAAGVYFCRLCAGDCSKIKKMVKLP